MCQGLPPGRLEAVRRLFSESNKEEQIMTTIFCLMLFVVLVILSLTAQQWLFQDADQVYDPEWERYQQRYD
jgi:hypothetical protein